MPENPLERAPTLAEINTEVLFGDIWGRPEQLGFHLGRATENGVTREELVEGITPDDTDPDSSTGTEEPGR